MTRSTLGHLLTASFCLTLLFSASALQFTTVSNSTTLNFDRIRTWHGMANLPATYNHLFFSHFTVFAPEDRALSKYISENDLNCAVSSPNALLGSRVDLEGSPPASFGITNADSMAKDGLLPFFTLLSFYIKPLDAPPPSTTVFVKGYSYRQKMPLQWHVDVVNGYHLPLLVNMQEFSGMSWDELYRVEMWADYGEDALDWEFCVDDLEIQFYQNSRTITEN